MQEIIREIFGEINKSDQQETFSKYEINYNCKDIRRLSSNLNQVNYQKLNLKLKEFGYKWDIHIEDFEFSISQDSYEELKTTKDDDNSEFQVSFKIHKEGEKIIIIDEDLFNLFIAEIDLESILIMFSQKEFPISFIGEDYKLQIGSKLEQKKVLYLSNQCNFRNYSQYPYSPDYFYFEKTKETASSNLIDLMSRISLIYCLIYIFDSTEIVENKIECTISGFKTIKYSLDFKKIDVSLLEHYFRIYSWVYSEPNKTEDKIGLTKNILTSYLKENSLCIDNKVFSSILSSNQIYVKGNISKYFEVRNKIIDQIEQTINGVNKSIDSFVNKFQKSTFIYISFFLSVFIFKVVNNSALERVFTKETSQLGLGFIAISFLYLIASLIITNLDKKRLKNRYVNVKNRYHDVLINEDIDKILNKDSEFKNEIKHLNDRIIIYSILWILSLVVFLVALYSASEYLNLTSF